MSNVWPERLSEKKGRNMTTKDTPGTLPIYLYAADSPTVQPLDFTVPSAAGIGKRTTETLYKLSQIVCVKADSNESHHLFTIACRQENVSVGMKRVKAKVSIQDPFNPVLFTEGAERYVIVIVIRNLYSAKTMSM